MVQFTTKDIKEFFFPLAVARPEVALFLVVCIAMISVHVMNLIMAVVIEGAMARGEADLGEKQKLLRHRVLTHRPELEKVFRELDEDQCGELFVGDLLSLNLDDPKYKHLD